MKILLINQTFYPDPSSTGQHLTDLACDLAGGGWKVTVLTGRRGYTEPHPLFPAKEVYKGIRIKRVCRVAFGKKYPILRILEAFLLNVVFAWNLLWMGSFDRVVALTTPPLVGAIALIYAKVKNIPFIYWVMDLNPDQAIRLGWLSQRSLRAKGMEALSRTILAKAERVIVLDEFMREKVLAKVKINDKIHVIPPWPHDEDLETIPHHRNLFRLSLNIQQKFIVMYSGNHSLCHPLDTILEAALILKYDPSFCFLFVGGGVRFKEVTRFKTKNELKNILQFPHVDRDQLKHSLSAADLHTVVMGEPFVGIVHPCKIYGIMKIGRPFVYIGPKESSIGRLVSSKNLGYQVNHYDSEQLVQIIQQSRQLNSQEKDEISKNQKSLAVDFSRRKLTSQLTNIILTCKGR